MLVLAQLVSFVIPALYTLQPLHQHHAHTTPTPPPPHLHPHTFLLQAAQRGLAEMWTRHRRAAGQQGGASFGNSPGSNGGGGSTSASLDGGRGSTSGAASGAKAEGEGERLVTRKVTRGDFEEALKVRQALG